MTHFINLPSRIYLPDIDTNANDMRYTAVDKIAWYKNVELGLIEKARKCQNTF